MKQQINLYQPPLRIEQPPVSAQQMGWALLAFAAVLVVWLGVDYYRTQNIAQQLSEELTREQGAIQNFAQLQQKLKPASEDPELADRVKRLTEQHQLQQLALETLQSRLPDKQVELRNRLEALARQHPGGLWLTHIRIADNGDLLSLEGRALSPALITDFLQRLSQEPAIAGLQFRQVRFGAPASSGDQAKEPGIHFEVSTRQQQDKPASVVGSLLP